MDLVIAFLVTTYFVAPLLADKILKERVKRYVVKNYKKMEKSGKGSRQFFLYNHRYVLTWTNKQLTETQIASE